MARQCALPLGSARRHEAPPRVRLRRSAHAGVDAPVATFPLGMLESRLRCPRCGSRRVRVAFSVQATPVRASGKWTCF